VDLYKKKNNGSNMLPSALEQLEKSLLEKENKPNSSEKRIDLLARNPNRLKNNRINQNIFTRNPNNFGNEAMEPNLRKQPLQSIQKGINR
jgi:hypothetical protein